MTDTNTRLIDRKARVHQAPIEYDKRPIEVRILDFDEVTLGFDPKTAALEASRCMQCPEPQPCTLRCPAGNDVPQALWLISQGDYYWRGPGLLRNQFLARSVRQGMPQPMPAGLCLRPGLWRSLRWKARGFAADVARKAGALAIPVPEHKTGKRVAIVGSGPAGITVAEDMVKQGHDVTVYEAWPMAGGVLIYGIPNFKVDKHLVQYKIDDLKEAGVRFVTNTRIGEAITVDDLLRDYDAVFLGTGSGVEASMDIPGEKLQGVYQATEFLVRANVPPEMLPPDRRSKPLVGRRVAIIGGGDTAVDCARSSIRLGAEEVTIVYRRTEAEMPGNKVERGVSIDEGVAIRYLEAPVEFIGDDAGHVTAMKVIRMRLGEPDKSGRRSPVPVEGSEFVEPIDTVVLAVGYWPDPLMGNTTPNLATRKWGLIVADEETGATTREGVFAAGDNVHGPDLVITAIATAHKASKSIDAYLSGAHIPKPTTNGKSRS